MPPVPASRSGGDCGPDTAMWLLNEHGPALYRARSPETSAGVRKTLMNAWEGILREDMSGDEGKAFVHQRLEQVPEAMAEETLDGQVALTLQALLRGEDHVDTTDVPANTGAARPLTEATDMSDKFEATEVSGLSEDSVGPVFGEVTPPPTLPYWFLPTDWARLAEAYQVDFVLHGLPGTENCQCGHCGCNGHVHVGPRSPGIDLCLHVGWRGASRKTGSRDNDDKLKDRDAAWGHWEPLGSGPIKAPLPRQQTTLDSELDLSNALKDGEQGNVDYQSWERSSAEDLIHSSWALAGFNCVQITSCACQPAICQPADKSGRPCPKLKDCCDTDRRVSDDGVGDVATVDGKTGGDGDVTNIVTEGPPTCDTDLAQAAQSVASPNGGRNGGAGAGAGARFSVLLEGRALFEGVDLEDNSPLRQADAAAGGSAGEADLERFRRAFIEAISSAAGILPARVKILNIGVPFENRVKKTAQRPAAFVTPTKELVSPLKEPDSGAGVLRFLTDDAEAPTADSALSSPPTAIDSPSTTRSDATSPRTAPPTPNSTDVMAPATPPASAPTPWQTPVEADLATPDRPDRPATDSARDIQANVGTGTVRVLAVLREPQRSVEATEREEPDAMMALELVVTELANPNSTLQSALRVSTDDRIQRIWCPEAEGPRKGPHRTRARQLATSGAVARLRLAKRMG